MLDCGLDLIAEVLYGKWKMRLLYFIYLDHLRPSELQRKIPDASPRVLLQQLKELETHNLLGKTIYAQVPAKVEYHLKELGRSLIPVIEALGNWADAHQKALRQTILDSHIHKAIITKVTSTD